MGKLNNISYYRIELEKHQATARKLVLDEIEAEVDRLRNYVDNIDLDSMNELQEGIQYVQTALRELSEKLF